jgi:hypothetical protein
MLAFYITQIIGSELNIKLCLEKNGVVNTFLIHSDLQNR